MDNTTKEITKIEWTKRWSGAFSLLNSSYWGKQYIDGTKKTLGVGFSNILFIHENDNTTLYRSKKETNIFGESLAKTATENPQILINWANNLKEKSDRIRELIKQDINLFLIIEKYKVFEKYFEEFLPFHVSINTILDYLPQKLVEKFEPILKDARIYSESIYNETKEFFSSLAKIISKKVNLEENLVLCLFNYELIDYLKTQELPNKNILEKRQKLSGMYFNNGRFYELFNNDVLKIKETLSPLPTELPNEIRGDVASMGVAKGICRIITNPLETKEFNTGDILVAVSTRPDFLFLIEKAAAIVTDSGGVLSHAAIVARELKKPCIVGTEIATNFFKEGDKLEVDANTGIIRKLP